MASLYWRGISTSWNNDNSWSLTDGGGSDGHVPLTSDDVYFTANGNGSGCTLDVAASCNTFNAVASSWTGNFSMGGFTITLASTFNIASAGTWLLNATITQSGDADFTIASTIGTFTGGGSLVLQGTGTLTISKNISASTLLNITCGASGKTTTYTSTADAACMNGLLTVGAGTLALSYYFYMRADSANLFSQTGTITSASGKGFIIQYGTAAAWNLPALTLGGSAYIYISNTSGIQWTITQTGNISTGRSFTIVSALTNSAVIFHTGVSPYYNITTGTYLTFTGNAGCTLTANINSSTIIVGTTFSAITSNNTINMGSSQWTIAGSFTLSATDTVDAGTSLITFTAAATLTSAGKTLYNITTSAGVLTNSGTLTCRTLGTTGTGGFNSGAVAITASSTISFAGSGANTFTSSTFTQTGNANFTIASTSSAVTGIATATLILQGTGTYLCGKASHYWLLISVANTGKTTTWSASTVSSGGYTMTIGAGTFTINAVQCYNYSATGAPVLNVDPSATINGTGWLTVAMPGGTYNCTLPAITLTGTLTLYLYKVFATGISTMTMSGHISAPNIIISNSGASGSFVFNTGTNPNYYNITATTSLIIGGGHATSASTYNLNSSTITAASLLNTYNLGTNNVNMSSSSWVMSGACTISSSWVLDAGTSLITFTAGSTLTSAGKTLYAVTHNSLGNVLALADALSCTNLTLTTGTITATAASVIVSGALTETLGTITFGANAVSTGSFNQIDGAITATSGTWSVGGNFTLVSGGTFTHNNGTVEFTNSGILISAGKTMYGITTSAGTLTNSGTLSCNTLSTIGTAGIDLGSVAITVASTVSLAGSGSMTLTGASIVQTGDADFIIESTIETYTGAFALELQGTGNLTVNKAISTALPIISNLTLANTGKVTTFNGIQSCSINGVLTVGLGTLTLSPSATAKGISIVCDNANPIVKNGTINGTVFSNYIALYNGLAGTVTIPELTLGGTTVFYALKFFNGSVIYNMSGDISAASIYMTSNATTGTYTFNTGSSPYYNISATLSISCTSQLGANYTINCYSSIFTSPVFNFSSGASGVLNLNMGSAQFNATGGGNIGFTGASTVVSPGTSIINISGATSIRSIGYVLNDISCTNGLLTNTITSLSCNNLSITGTGGFAQGGFAVTCSGDFSYSGSTNGTLDSTFTMTGLNKAWSITSSGTVTTTSCVLELQKNTTVTSGTRTISRMILTDGKIYTFTNTNILSITNYTDGDWSGTYENPITLQSSSPGSPFSINAPIGTIVLWVVFSSCNATGGARIKAYYCDDSGTYDSSGIVWYEKPLIGGHPRSMIRHDKHDRVRVI